MSLPIVLQHWALKLAICAKSCYHNVLVCISLSVIEVDSFRCVCSFVNFLFMIFAHYSTHSFMFFLLIYESLLCNINPNLSLSFNFMIFLFFLINSYEVKSLFFLLCFLCLPSCLKEPSTHWIYEFVTIFYSVSLCFNVFI